MPKPGMACFGIPRSRAVPLALADARSGADNKLQLNKGKCMGINHRVHLSKQGARFVINALLAIGLVSYGASSFAGGSTTTTWFSGQRAFGKVTVEPAIDSATGNEIFLLTPDNAPMPTNSAPRAHAPLYLVLYPESSTVDANSLNCHPTNCNHVQTFPPYGMPLKGHDHLVGVPHTGDFNVAWDVILIAFSENGFKDGAIDRRILTLDELNAALAAGDAFSIGPVTNFDCSITSITTYVKGTVLTFPPP
jgi:hypothetical protein